MEENEDKEGEIDFKKLNSIIKVREKVVTAELKKLDEKRMKKE